MAISGLQVPESWQILKRDPVLMYPSLQVKKALVSGGYLPYSGASVYTIVPFPRFIGGQVATEILL